MSAPTWPSTGGEVRASHGERERRAHLPRLARRARVQQRRGRPPAKLPPSAYADIPDEDVDFGTHELPSLELCAMQGQGELDYYPVLATMATGGGAA